MSNFNAMKSKIFDEIAKLANVSTPNISDETPLVGHGSLLDSMLLVELCLILEDQATDLGFIFDWTSEAAMSKSRGIFRTAGALVKEFCDQRESQK